MNLRTHNLHTKKIKVNPKAIIKRKLEIARKVASCSVVGLDPMDLGPILFGKLTKDRHVDSNSTIVRAFTKDNILVSYDKVFY